MKHVFIINPTAGKVNAKTRLVPEIRAAADKLGVETEILVTERHGHAIELAEQVVLRGEPVRLYACGGDGTLNEVLCGVRRSGVPLEQVAVGHIPSGSGNDMIRNFGPAEKFRSLEQMILGTTKVIDLIKVNGRTAASICAAGLDAKVAYNIPLFRRLPLCGGSMAYNLSILKCLTEKMGIHLKVESDAGNFEGDYLLTAIGNGSYYGGGYCSLPGAKTDDGLLNVVLVKKIPVWRIPAILGRYKAGEHFAPNGEIADDLKDIITSFAVHKIIISSDTDFYYTVDGECETCRRICVQVLPDAVQFILPANLNEE